MTKRTTNPAFLNGVPEMLLLQLLAGRPMYGYELVQAIRTQTDARLEFGEGCIYPILHRLEADELLESHRQLVGGRNRVVYRITSQGRRRLRETVRDWRNITEAIQICLQGGTHARPELA
jgi:PadR family transcriptional regulator PadR